MSATATPKGPWTHRFLVHLFTVTLTILTFWLLGFVVDDIGELPGPEYSDVEKRLLDQTLVGRLDDLRTQSADIERRIRELESRQKILADSTASSQRTMNQLIEIRNLGLKQGVTPTAEEQQAQAESQRLFLANQQQYQQLNAQIADLNLQLQETENKQRELEDELNEKKEPIRREYERLERQHEVKLAVFKLGALAPVVLISFLLFYKFRGSAYAPLIYALGIATAIKTADVMHEHFPTEYFKYVLILISLAIVVRILVHLLKMVAAPKRAWLLNQYREAYEAFLCPVCEFPIRRGPLKYLFWTRRSLRKLLVPAASPGQEEGPYTCPMCKTRLYEECASCHATRHSLLPACEKCGAEKGESKLIGDNLPGEPASTA
jgi:hypothetical protein